jgi:hypothetical protein
MIDPNYYNVRLDGPAADYRLCSSISTDYRGTEKPNFWVSSTRAESGGNISGAVILVPNSVANASAGTGNVVDLAEPGAYTIRYNGTNASDRLGAFIEGIDLNNDGISDLIANAFSTDFNNRTDSGSIFIILGDSPLVTIASADSFSTLTPTISGMVTTTYPNVGGVEISIDGAAWVDAIASDGGYDSKSEAWLYVVPTPLTNGLHELRVRGYTIRGEYTIITQYTTQEFTLQEEPAEQEQQLAETGIGLLQVVIVGVCCLPLSLLIRKRGVTN